MERLREFLLELAQELHILQLRPDGGLGGHELREFGNCIRTRNPENSGMNSARCIFHRCERVGGVAAEGGDQGRNWAIQENIVFNCKDRSGAGREEEFLQEEEPFANKFPEPVSEFGIAPERPEELAVVFGRLQGVRELELNTAGFFEPGPKGVGLLATLEENLNSSCLPVRIPEAELVNTVLEMPWNGLSKMDKHYCMGGSGHLKGVGAPGLGIWAPFSERATHDVS